MNPNSISLIIEWENILLAEKIRGQRMVETVVEQLGLLPQEIEVELLICYDKSQIDPSELMPGSKNKAPMTVRFIDSGDRHYYEIKNFGALRSSGDILIFVDSDVIPHKEWLKNLLDSFKEKEVNVVCGSTIMDCNNLYSQSLALFWFFPFDKGSAGLKETNSFYANNVAFKREVFISNPFPDLPQMRGQCHLLSEQLREKGIKIYIQEKSKVFHPPPNGLIHFLKRGIAYGHDAYLKARKTGNFIWYSPFGSLVRSGTYFFRAIFKIIKNHSQVGLAWYLILIPIFIAFGFYGLMLIGEVLSMLFPGFVRKHFWI